MLSDEGNAFAGCYYGDNGLFLDDHADAFEEHMSVAPESAHDFARFSSILDARLASGILTKQQRKSKPRWKVW